MNCRRPRKQGSSGGHIGQVLGTMMMIVMMNVFSIRILLQQSLHLNMIVIARRLPRSPSARWRSWRLPPATTWWWRRRRRPGCCPPTVRPSPPSTSTRRPGRESWDDLQWAVLGQSISDKYILKYLKKEGESRGYKCCYALCCDIYFFTLNIIFKTCSIQFFTFSLTSELTTSQEFTLMINHQIQK